MSQVLLVACGGAFGSIARYGLSVALARSFGSALPWGTLAANLLGGLAMGVLAARLGGANEGVRLLLGVGFLGGFTTFSAFSLETVRLMETSPTTGLTYAAASLLLSVGACWVGLFLGRL